MVTVIITKMDKYIIDNFSRSNSGVEYLIGNE